MFCNIFGLMDRGRERMLDRNLIANANHICIIGPPGSGKTTFSKTICELLSFKHIQMDDIGYEFFLEHGRNPDEEEWLRCLELKLQEKRIVTDGFYRLSITRRFEHADVIIYFHYSRIFCLYWAFLRGLKNLWVNTTAHPSTRESFMMRIQYCFGLRLYKRIWSFYSLNLGFLKELQRTHKSKPLVTFQNRSDMTAFLQMIREGDS